jgi:hypothetical protein
VPFTEEEAVEEAARDQQLVREELAEQGEASMRGWGSLSQNLLPGHLGVESGGKKL